MIFAIILLAACAVYILSADYNYIGIYNDDAWYITLARYAAGVQEIQRPAMERPAGFILFLVPVAWLFPEGISVYRIVPFFFTLCILTAAFIYFRKYLDVPRLLVLTALIGFNRYFVIYSSSVMAETAYIFFVLLAFIISRNRADPDKPDIRRMLLLALVCSCTFYMKYLGILVFFSFFIDFCIRKRYKDALYLLFFFLVFSFPFMYHSATVTTGSLNKYLAEVKETYSRSAAGVLLLKNAVYYFLWAAGTCMMNYEPQAGGLFIRKAESVLIFAFFCVFIIRGILMKNGRESFRPAVIYTVLHLALYMLWVNVAVRYMLPIMPLLLFFFIRGTKGIKKGFFYAVSAVLLLCYISSDAKIVAASLSHERRRSSPLAPFDTYEWVKENTSKDDIFFGQITSRFFLYTGRVMNYSIDFTLRDEFYLMLLLGNYDYVALFSIEDVQPGLEYSLTHGQYALMLGYLADETRFRRVFSDPDEETSIWEVRKNPDFVKAWQRYHEGLTAYYTGRKEEAARVLEDALRISADFPSVAADLAKIYMDYGEHTKALDIIARALDLYPESLLLHMVRGELYMQEGKTEKAREDIGKALAIAGTIGARKYYGRLRKDMAALEPQEGASKEVQ